MLTVNHAGYEITDEDFACVDRPGGSGDFLFVCFDTAMHVISGEEIVTTAPGACILYTPGSAQYFRAEQEYRLSFVHFSAGRKEIEAFGLPLDRPFYTKDVQQAQDFLFQIQAEYFTRSLFSDTAAGALVLQLLIVLSREKHAESFVSETEQKLYNLFCQARYTMLSNCEKEWASTNMCQMVSLSRSQFYKYYEDFFGISPMADLNRARIEKAKNLLTNETLQVTEVAKRCGYASIHHFSRTFKEHVGLSPMAYVKEMRWS